MEPQGDVLRTECMMPNCIWINDITKLEEHFMETHKKNFVKAVHNTLFEIKLEHVLLQTRKSCTKYIQLNINGAQTHFWFRFYKTMNKRFLMMFYIACIENGRITPRQYNYTLRAPPYPVNYTQTCSNTWKKNDVLSDKFIKGGMNISRIKANDIKIKISQVPETLILPNQESNEECNWCSTQIRRPNVLCPNDHTACLNCFMENEECRIERCFNNVLNDPRNIEPQNDSPFLNIFYRCYNDGCNEKGNIQTLGPHLTRCKFTPTECVINICRFRGTHFDILKHLKERHECFEFKNDSILKDIFIKTQRFCIIGDELFYIKYIKHENKSYLYVFHLTDENESTFVYNLTCMKHKNKACSVTSRNINVSAITDIRKKVDYVYDISNEIDPSCSFKLTIFPFDQPLANNSRTRFHTL